MKVSSNIIHAINEMPLSQVKYVDVGDCLYSRLLLVSGPRFGELYIALNSSL